LTFFVVLRRELNALLVLPQTYAIAAAYLVISGIFFVNILTSTRVPDLGQYYSNVASTLIVLCPIASMRSFAEERKSGSLDITLSWPVSRTGLVLGKFVANTVFVSILISVGWVYFRLLGTITSVSVARTAGGYIGMLLLAMAFNALTLVVAVRSSSPTGAAFLGFGLLLFLWILEFAPTFIRGTLRELSPTAHLESFSRGVLHVQDVAYFAIVVVVGLVLAVGALAKTNPGTGSGSFLRRSIAPLVVLLALAGSLHLVERLDGQLDLTAAKRNEATPATRDVLRRVETPITVTGFIQPLTVEATRLRSVEKMYRAAGADLRVRIVDPDLQPAVTRQLGIKDYNQYLVEVGDRREVLDDLEQVSLTSAINRLSRPAPPDACFTIGHGERSIDDSGRSGIQALAGELRTISYDVETVALAAAGGSERLNRCDVVLVMGPTVPFLSQEMDLLTAYAQRGGRLVVMADGAEGLPEELNTFLRRWGIGLGNGIVRDLSALVDDPASIVSFDFPSLSPVTERLGAGIPVVLANALPVENTAGEGDEGSHLTNLVRSSGRSWIEQPASPESRRDGPFSLAVVLDSSRVTDAESTSGPAIERTRIGLVGSVEIATNRLIQFLGNREFTSRLVQWVGREDDLIAAAREATGLYRIAITESQQQGLVRKAIVLPTLAALVPFPVAWYRLRRG
jgi:ABC-type transport system involved in multi-copper enzyme maturation permease subunit